MRLAKGTPIWLLLLSVLSLLPLLLIFVVGPILPIVLTLILLLSSLTLLLFFRDPDRKIADGIVSPADGKVVRVERKRRKCFISIFMNVHNVHVNRAPFDCRVRCLTHIPGGYVPAFSKDSDRNERVVIDLDTGNGRWKVTQIAGAVARRIVPYVREGDELLKGERFGLIRFGSRVDLEMLLPSGYEVLVSPGNKVRAGSSCLADHVSGGRSRRRDPDGRR